MVKRLLILAACLAFGTINLSSAFAAAPTLLSIGHTERQLTATWSVPPNVYAFSIEVATNPAVDDIGFFLREHKKVDAMLELGQTSYEAGFQLLPGRYYVHVAGLDLGPGCDECIFQFSNILSVDIPSDPSSTSPSPSTPSPNQESTSKVGILSKRKAKSYIRRAIKKKQRKNPRRLKRSCKRSSNTKFKCRVRWERKTRRYRGSMTIWIGVKNNKAYWKYKFRGTSKKKKCRAKRKSKCSKKVRW